MVSETLLDLLPPKEANVIFKNLFLQIGIVFPRPSNQENMGFLAATLVHSVQPHKNK